MPARIERSELAFSTKQSNEVNQYSKWVDSLDFTDAHAAYMQLDNLLSDSDRFKGKLIWNKTNVLNNQLIWLHLEGYK